MYKYFALLGLLFIAAGCGSSANIKVTGKNLVPTCLIHYNNSTFYRLRIWNNSNQQYLWIIKWAGENPEEIKYGMIPKGTRQHYPHLDKAPLQLKSGDVIAVSLTYNYDHWAGPTTETRTQLYIIKENGIIRADGAINYPPREPKDDWPPLKETNPHL